MICGGMQALSNLLYAVQVWAGHDVAMLTLTIAAENVTGGMASAAFVAYLSLLCSREFTATQYALLSSMATVGLNVLAASGGALAEALGWIPFFVLSTLFCVPSLVLRHLIGSAGAGSLPAFEQAVGFRLAATRARGSSQMVPNCCGHQLP